MAKNIIINDGNYKISVDDTNSIILDVGATGVVQVTGDLQVDGTQTTVNSVSYTHLTLPTKRIV